jgi:8-oxo-dGTP pyrophosphatase MutT (NUDIX family)
MGVPEFSGTDGREKMMEKEKSCGAIVFRKVKNKIEVLVIKHRNGGHWSFPKGHVEGSETEHETAKREIFEETGIDVSFVTGFREMVSYSPKPRVIKDVVYFLAEALNHDFVMQEEELSQIRWININDAEKYLTYNNDKGLIFSARTALKRM